MIEVFREIFEPLGYEVQYLNTSWKRAVVETLKGEFDAAIGASPIDGEGLIFPEEELCRVRLSFFVKAGNPWQFEATSSITGKTVAVIEGYDYRPWFNQYISEHRNDPELIQEVRGEAPLRQNIQKLLAGRVDIVAGNKYCIEYVARELGVLDSIRFAGAGNRYTDYYIAFSPANADSTQLAQTLSEGIRALRSSGRLEAILNQYGLSDWK